MRIRISSAGRFPLANVILLMGAAAGTACAGPADNPVAGPPPVPAAVPAVVPVIGPRPIPGPPPPPAATGNLSSSLGMTFVRIPAGTFTMGSSGKGDDAGKDERPHVVRIGKAFQMGVVPVTNAQF